MLVLIMCAKIVAFQIGGVLLMNCHTRILIPLVDSEHVKLYIPVHAGLFVILSPPAMTTTSNAKNFIW